MSEWRLARGADWLSIVRAGLTSAGEAVAEPRPPNAARQQLGRYEDDPDAAAILRSIVAAEQPQGSPRFLDDAAVFDVMALLVERGLYRLVPGRTELRPNANRARPPRPPPPAPAPGPVAPGRRTGPPRPSGPVGPPGPAPGPAPAPVATLSWYELVLLDELERGIAGVAIELSSPAGTRTLTTNGAGIVRLDDVPPGEASARVADPAQLAAALASLADTPKRRTRPPDETADLAVVTVPTLRTVTFPDARRQRIMVLARVDVVALSLGGHWRSIHLVEEESASRWYGSEHGGVLQLCATGSRRPAVLAPPPLMPLEPPEPAPLEPILADPPPTLPDWLLGESPVGYPEPAPSRPLRMAFDPDALYAALLAGDDAGAERALEAAFEAPPPAPAPAWPAPLGEASEFANAVIRLALKGVVDHPEAPDVLI